MWGLVFTTGTRLGGTADSSRTFGSAFAFALAFLASPRIGHWGALAGSSSWFSLSAGVS